MVVVVEVRQRFRNDGLCQAARSDELQSPSGISRPANLMYGVFGPILVLFQPGLFFFFFLGRWMLEVNHERCLQLV